MWNRRPPPTRDKLLDSGPDKDTGIYAHMRRGRRKNGGGAFYTAFTDARDAARFTRQGTACVRACVRAAVVWVSRGGHLSSEVCADSITREKENQTERTPSAKQRQGR